MGNVQDFIMGGSKNSSKSSNSSSSDSDSNSSSQQQSSNASENKSYQGGSSVSKNKNSSGSFNSNQAYGTLSNALTPSLGYVNAAGNMIGALLGLTPSPAKAVPFKPPSMMPAGGNDVSIALPPVTPPPGFDMTTPPVVAPPLVVPPTPAPGPAPTPTPAPIPGPAPAPAPVPSGPHVPATPLFQPGDYYEGGSNGIPHYASGGAISAGQPAVVGEHRPELFVPKTDGYIVPQVPGMPNQNPQRSNYLQTLLGQLSPQITSQLQQYLPQLSGQSPMSPVNGYRDAIHDWRDQRPEDRSDRGAMHDWRDQRPTHHDYMHPDTPGRQGTPPIMAPGQMHTEVMPQTFVPPQPRALGGPVESGHPYVVGENRAEAFIPTNVKSRLPAYQAYQTAHPPGGTPPIMAPGANMGGSGAAPAAGSATAPAAPAPLDPAGALNTYADSAGMNFILGQGQKAISGQNAGAGVFNSGATGKALEQYGQGLGTQYLNQYMNSLFDYAKLGLGSASALGGAGGVGGSQSAGAGGSASNNYGASYGSSAGSSTGTSTSTSTSNSSASGTGSSKGHQKNGLIPDLTNAASAYASGGGKF